MREEFRKLLLRSLLVLLFLGLHTLLSGCKSRILPPADKIFINGNVVTMREDEPVVEAFAAGEGKFVAVGKSEEIRTLYPNTDTIDLRGKTVMPGIIESHGHLLSLGQSFLELNMEGMSSQNDIIQKVRNRVKDMLPGQWITGWGWDEGEWAKNYPDNSSLNEISPDNPVYLRGLHGFACWVNDKALEIAGITKDTPDPANGSILKDADTGKPIGILTNSAQELITSHIPPLQPSQIKQALKLSIEECLRFGLTTVHEARTTAAMLEALRSLKEQDELRCRVYVMLDWTDKELLKRFFQKGPVIDPEHLLTIRCIKIFADGALGSRGAALFLPYSDEPGERGLIVTPEEEIFRLTVIALKRGFQVAVHAIGDRANRKTLNAFELALKEVPELKDHRLRVEHAQIVALEDIPRFAPLGIVLSMQPSHCTSDMGWVESRIGAERLKGAYAWKSFQETGVHLTLNSDFPGETLNPFVGMYAAMTRQTPEGQPPGGWFPAQCLTRKEVLRAYTLEAAYSGFEERIKGAIKPGMVADFIILSDDILSVPVKKFLDLKVEQTYLSGKLVYSQQE